MKTLGRCTKSIELIPENGENSEEENPCGQALHFPGVAGEGGKFSGILGWLYA